jgi:hypothetical protein
MVTLVASLACLLLALPAFAAFDWTDENGALRLSWDGQPVLQYNYETVEPPEGVGDAFARNAYLHPVWSPTGQIVTDDFPADHYHQRGIFLAWTKTEFGDLHPDFWNLGSLTGRIICEQVESKDADAAGATLVTKHLWQARRGEAWVPVLRETWTIRVHAPTAADADCWTMDLTSRQECATDTPLVLPVYFYGGFAYRGARAWLEQRDLAWALTSEGKARQSADRTTGKWCVMGGPLGDGWGGATVMDHPGNLRHPNWLRVHPSIPYFGYMLPQAEAFTFEPGKEHLFRYRILVHSSQPTAEQLEALWQEYRGT